jgi:hypothetical protein
VARQKEIASVPHTVRLAFHPLLRTYPLLFVRDGPVAPGDQHESAKAEPRVEPIDQPQNPDNPRFNPATASAAAR